MNEKLMLAPGYIIASFSKVSLFEAPTQNSSFLVRRVMNAQITSLKINVEFTPINLYRSLLLCKISKFYIVFVIPESDVRDQIIDDYKTHAEYKSDELFFNISVITFEGYLRIMRERSGIRTENCTLVIFTNFAWSHIVKSLANERYFVSGGFSSKRHLSSHLSIRHHAYLLSLFNFDLVALDHSINFNDADPNYLLVREDLYRNRRSNVKIRDGRRAVFIKENKEVQKYLSDVVDNKNRGDSIINDGVFNSNNSPLNSTPICQNNNTPHKRGYHFSSLLNKNSFKRYSTDNNHSKNEFNMYIFTQLESIIKINPPLGGGLNLSNMTSKHPWQMQARATRKGIGPVEG